MQAKNHQEPGPGAAVRPLDWELYAGWKNFASPCPLVMRICRLGPSAAGLSQARLALQFSEETARIPPRSGEQENRSRAARSPSNRSLFACRKRSGAGNKREEGPSMPAFMRWILGLCIAALVTVVPIVDYRWQYTRNKRLREVNPGVLYRSGQMTSSGIEE